MGRGVVALPLFEAVIIVDIAHDSTNGLLAINILP